MTRVIRGVRSRAADRAADELSKSYKAVEENADECRAEFEKQLTRIVNAHSLSPTLLESRIKKWPSVAKKADRWRQHTGEYPSSILKFQDLIGLRSVFLFSEEVEQAKRLIKRNFKDAIEDNKSDDLGVKEFGYQSVHFVVGFPRKWRGVPTNKEFTRFRAEIQVRTLAQHIWAVASHVLQYKQEAGVPRHIQRSIHRLAALLELIDLELERIKRDRGNYFKQMAKIIKESRKSLPAEIMNVELNVDLLAAVLDARLPSVHRIRNEQYGTLLDDLQIVGIRTVGQLIRLINRNLRKAERNDAYALKQFRRKKPPYTGEPGKIKRGVFYSQVGLVQNMLHEPFEDWRQRRGGNRDS